MALVGRQYEREILAKLYDSDRAEFLALYGRRRVGKTFLIQQFIAKRQARAFYVTGIKDAPFSAQMTRFMKAMSDTFHQGYTLDPQDNWLSAFDKLLESITTHLGKTEKLILFFDEFPWMVTHKSGLLQALDHFWNQYFSQDGRIKLVICGSSASWIINNIINNKGGLHNRVTRKMLLKPFNLYETREFLLAKKIKLNHWQTTELYMVTGGIPFYLSFVEKGQSAAQMIESLVFREDAPLLNEFENLFSSLFEDATPYVDLVRVLAGHRYGMTQADMLKALPQLSKGGRLVDRLRDLQEAGFILSLTPFQHKKRGTYYRVIDEYTLFYFHWIEPMRRRLNEQALTSGYWQEIQRSAAWHSWAGYSFEGIVYKHIVSIRRKLGLSPTAIADSWRYQAPPRSKEVGAQIDLLFDRRDEAITLCEIKYTPKPFVIDKSYAEQLARKKAVFAEKTGTQKQLFLALIAAAGVKTNSYSEELVDNTITLEDLFAPVDG